MVSCETSSGNGTQALVKSTKSYRWLLSSPGFFRSFRSISPTLTSFGFVNDALKILLLKKSTNFLKATLLLLDHNPRGDMIEDVIRGSASGQYVEKIIRLFDPHTANNPDSPVK